MIDRCLAQAITSGAAKDSPAVDVVLADLREKWSQLREDDPDFDLVLVLVPKGEGFRASAQITAGFGGGA